ncbi:MAG: hypothetical protein Q9172_003885 [Xanthocarpia lactea]
MIFREILLPPVDDAEMKRLYHKRWETATNNEEVEKIRKYHTTKLLLINKQFNAEACKLLSEERYYQSFVPSYLIYAGYSYSIYSGYPDLEAPLKNLPPFELLPTVRNIQLTLPVAWVSTKLLDHQDHYIDLFAKLLSVPCNDLASESPRLRNLTVYLPCRCPENHGYKAGDRRPAHLQCFHADKVAALLAPIRRLRARSIRFVLDCTSQVIAELQPVFQDIVAIVQSSKPIESLTSKQNEWFELRLEAKRRGFFEEISRELKSAWYDIGDRYRIRPYATVEEETYQFHMQRPRQRLEESLDERVKIWSMCSVRIYCYNTKFVEVAGKSTKKDASPWRQGTKLTRSLNPSRERPRTAPAASHEPRIQYNLSDRFIAFRRSLESILKYAIRLRNLSCK